MNRYVYVYIFDIEDGIQLLSESEHGLDLDWELLFYDEKRSFCCTTTMNRWALKDCYNCQNYPLIITLLELNSL